MRFSFAYIFRVPCESHLERLMLVHVFFLYDYFKSNKIYLLFISKVYFVIYDFTYIKKLDYKFKYNQKNLCICMCTQCLLFKLFVAPSKKIFWIHYTIYCCTLRNMAADWAAKHGLSIQSSFVWDRNPHRELLHIIIADSLGRTFERRASQAVVLTFFPNKKKYFNF